MDRRRGDPPDVASIMEPFGNAVHAAFGTEGGEDLLTNPVAVIGCGPIGLFAVGIARALGAWKVVAIEPNDDRRALAGAMGADLLVDRRSRIRSKWCSVRRRQRGGGRARDVGQREGHRPGHRMLARAGACRSSAFRTGGHDRPERSVIFKEARILGITGREMFRTWQQTTTLLSTGRVDVTPVITHRFALEDFAEAFATVLGSCGEGHRPS